MMQYEFEKSFVRKQTVVFAAFAHRKDIYKKFP